MAATTPTKESTETAPLVGQGDPNARFAGQGASPNPRPRSAIPTSSWPLRGFIDDPSNTNRYNWDTATGLESIKILNQQIGELIDGCRVLIPDTDSTLRREDDNNQVKRGDVQASKGPMRSMLAGTSPTMEQVYKRGFERVGSMIYAIDHNSNKCTLTFNLGSRLRQDEETSELRTSIESIHGVHRVRFFEPDDYAFTVAYGKLFRAEYIAERVVDAMREWDDPEMPALSD
jgi:hypothetical protein